MLRASVPVVVLVVALTGCGSSEPAAPTTTAPAKNARNATVQKAVAKDVQKQSETRAEDATGGFVDPEWQATKTDCIPESDSKLSCLVDGYIRAGFGEDADPDAEGPFQMRWEVIVDGATGRYQARTVDAG